MNYEIQFARVTNSGKLADRFLTCQHLQSEDLAKSAMGEIFALIEILSPWFPTAQIGKLIINNFAKFYYGGGSTSDLVNFENSLKHINEDLAQITQEGETEWIGNLNGILASIVGSNLHLAPSGRIDAFIFRDGKVNHLTYGLSETSQNHPLKTFSNVISGELKNHDKILITNKEVFNHLSLESIRQIITINSPSSAALQIAKLFKKARTRNVNLIIINLILKEELSNETIAKETESVFYLDKSMESPLIKVASFWKNLALPLIRIIRNKFKKSPRKLAKIKRETLAEKKEVSSKDESADRFEQEFIQGTRDDGLLKDEEIKYSPDLYIHYYNAKKAESLKGKKINKGLNFFGNFGLWLLDKIKLSFKFIVKTSRDRTRRKYLYIALAILLILIIGLVIFWRGKETKIGNLQSQKILDEAISLQKDGKNLLLSGDIEQAKAKFVLSIDKADSIKENSFVGNDALNTITSSYTELDKLTSATRFNELKPVITISETPKSFFVIGGETYLITDENIYKATFLGGSPAKVASIPKGQGNLSFGTRQDKIIYFYTSDQNLYQLDTNTDKLDQVKIAEASRWETANSIANYVGAIYLLDGVIGQIYKHSSTQNQFAKGEEYISATKINLKQSVSLAIDGSIYVLKNDGKVIKIQKSKLQDFSLKSIPTPYDEIKGPLKIFTDADTPSIYILDLSQKRILEFDKEGQFVHQYYLPQNFDKINDFAVSAKQRKIWILNGSSVYEISI